MLSSNMWLRLKVSEKDRLPSYCVTVPTPSELFKLEALSSQHIQHAKYHQTW